MTLSVTGLLAKPNLKDKTLGIYGIGQTTRGAVLGLACQIRRLGQPEMVTRQGETDVLFVFAFGTEPGRRLALHIENKLASGRFTAFQPEVYDARARLWCRN